MDWIPHLSWIRVILLEAPSLLHCPSPVLRLDLDLQRQLLLQVRFILLDAPILRSRNDTGWFPMMSYRQHCFQHRYGNHPRPASRISSSPASGMHCYTEWCRVWQSAFPGWFPFFGCCGVYDDDCDSTHAESVINASIRRLVSLKLMMGGLGWHYIVVNADPASL
jgi:hypothetical protein